MICSFCRYQNINEKIKCRNCKCTLIECKLFSEQDLKNRESFKYRDNLKRAYKIRLRPRITVIEKTKLNKENWMKQFEAIMQLIIDANKNFSSNFPCY